MVAKFYAILYQPFTKDSGRGHNTYLLVCFLRKKIGATSGVRASQETDFEFGGIRCGGKLERIVLVRKLANHGNYWY